MDAGGGERPVRHARRRCCGLPCRVSQEHTQPCEVVSIQMLLLFPERCEVSSCGILVPGAVALLRLGGSTPVSVLVPPNGEPCLQEAAGYADHGSNGTRVNGT